MWGGGGGGAQTIGTDAEVICSQESVAGANYVEWSITVASSVAVPISALL